MDKRESSHESATTNALPVQIPIAEMSDWVGHEFVSPWTLIDQDRIDRFADVSGDRSWVHVDVQAATSFRDGTIAHGLLTLSLYPALLFTMYEPVGISHGLNYGFDSVRFTGLVPVDSRLRMRLVIAEVERKGAGILITNQFEIERQGGARPVCVGRNLNLQFPLSPLP